jgi:hypothetical protein
MVSNRNLSIVLLITGSVGISFGGLIMRNINNADPWQIAFYRVLAVSDEGTIARSTDKGSSFSSVYYPNSGVLLDGTFSE